MIRLPLKQGDVLQLNSRQYTIESVLGDGASCIVYAAYYADSMGLHHRVNIKECYPYHANIVRVEQEITWHSGIEREHSFVSFRTAYEKLMTWQNENFAVNVFDLCEANGTLYIIMNADNGVTFDKDFTESLHEILKTIKLLTHFVGVYHENGYLHLDIKPSNFLVYPRPSEHIVLFDMDSVTSMEAIRERRVSCISYSEGWAAPEQKQGKAYQLCPATDIYAIGAILFEKVMGRPVEATDMGVFAKWDFKGDFFEDVNPKIKRVLKTIFQKTLAANVKRRYQATDELLADIDTACEITAGGKPYIISPDLHTPTYFVGRESEILAIHQAFSQRNKAVFLHGFGGIGKSSLAKAYAISYWESYDTVLFLDYRGSLKELLEDDDIIQIQNFDGEDTNRRKLLRRLLDKNTLLIVDNFDVATDEDPYLNEFLQLKAKMLFTTRTDFSDVLPGTSVQVELHGLPYSNLVELFSKASGITLRTEEQHDVFRKLLKLVADHTLTVELLARQIFASGWSLEQLYQKISDGISSLVTAEKVKMQKDGQITKGTVPAALRVLFDISGLDEESKQVLRNLSLLCPVIRVTRDTYKMFCVGRSTTYGFSGSTRMRSVYYSRFCSLDSSGDIDVLNELCERGWVHQNTSSYFLHPLVAELIQRDLMPCKKNCEKLYEYLESILFLFAECSIDDEADAREHWNHFELLCAFLKHIDFNDSFNREMALKFVQHAIDRDVTPAGWLVEDNFDDIIKKLLVTIRNQQASEREAFEINLVMLLLNIRIFHECDNSSVREGNVHTTYATVVNIAHHLPSVDYPNAVARIYDAIKRQLKEHIHPPKSFIKEIYKTNPEVFSGGVNKEYYESFYDLVPNQHTKPPIAPEIQLSEIEDSLEIWEKKIDEMYNEYRDSKNKLSYAQYLYKDSGLEIFQTVACLLDFCERIFRFSSFWRDYNSDQVRNFVHNIDWDGIEATLDFANQLQESKLWRREYDGYSLYEDACFAHKETGEPYRDSIFNTNLWRIHLAAIKNNKELFDQLSNEESNFVCTNPVYSEHYKKEMDPIWDVARVCWSLGKCHYVLPHLICWIKREEANCHFDERDYISIFENIIDFAKKACEEEGENSEYNQEYLQIANDFEARINGITRKFYELNKEGDEFLS